MALPQSTSNANQVVYASGIAAALSQVWLWDPSYALSADPAIYEKLARDCVIAGALDHLQRSIVGHDYSFEPEDDTVEGRALAKVVESLTKQQRGFSQSLYNLSRATFMGASWGLMFPERRVLKIGDGKPREWTVVARVRDVDKRRFRLSQQEFLSTVGLNAPARDGLNPGASRLNGLLGMGLNGADVTQSDPALSSGDVASPRGYDAGVLGKFRWEFNRGWSVLDQRSMWWGPLSVVAPDERWIQHVPDTSERGLGYGYGLADDIYFYFWAKQNVLKFGLQGLERWGQGFLYAKVKALRDGMAQGTSQANKLNQTVQSMRTWRSENMAAVDDQTELALLDMPATAEASCREWIEYLDREIVKRILAALQPTGGQAGHGSFSSAKVEEGSTEAMVAFLRSPLEETWTHSVVRFLLEHNQENLAELGLLEAGRPRLRLRGQESHDVDSVVKVFTLARDLGVPVRKSDFYSWTGLQPPNETEEAIVYPQPADPLAGAMSGFASPGAKGLPEDERAPVGEGGASVAETNQLNGAAA